MTISSGRLTVALDAEHMRQAAAGIARYGRGLATALRSRDDVTVIELGGGEVLLRGTLRKRLTTARQDFLWYPFIGRRAARKAGADIYHIPLPRGPIRHGKPPLVVTVHDLVPLLFPETVTPWSRIYGRLTLRRLVDAADMILTDSRNSAEDLRSLLHIPDDRIRVVYIGVDEMFFGMPADSPATMKRDPYVLFVGTPEPRKNLDRLIAAMAVLRKRGSNQRLVIVGGGGWGTAISDAPFAEQLGRVSEAELVDLYRNASCLALPSLHEGFGLPALEAMAVGTPVVAGNAGALPEITGGAAALVDPLNVDDIAAGIEDCIRNRATLVGAGRERAREFTWGKAAAETMAAYRDVL